jgi:general secretion pathway protein D
MRAGLISASLFCLFGCSPAYLEQRTDEPQSAADVVRGADLTPRFPTPVRTGAASSNDGGFTLFGSSAPGAAAQTATAEAAAGNGNPPDGMSQTADGYTLNFDNSPIANVAKVVLGDILSLS